MRSVHRFTKPKAFLTRAGSFLRASEVENALMLGICGSARFDDSCYLATVEEDRAVVACALRTPPHGALLTRADRESLESLAADLADKYEDLPAVAGPEPAVGVFATLWAARTGAAAGPAVRMRVFEASRVVQPPAAAGTFRRPPRRTCRLWPSGRRRSLKRQASTTRQTRMTSRVSGSVRAASFVGRTRVWCPWRLGRVARRIVRINYVYTPPEHRGRGYASACVASLTQQLLDEGVALCCLYTDLANPTSNRIYQAIGYRPVPATADYHGGRLTCGSS